MEPLNGCMPQAYVSILTRHMHVDTMGGMASSHLQLKNVSLSEEGRFTTASYDLRHTQSGRDGTTLTLDLNVKTGMGRCWVSLDGLTVERKDDDTEQALDKLAEWLERASIALRNRGTPKPAVAAYEHQCMEEEEQESADSQ
jgi:hypothetical protein